MYLNFIKIYYDFLHCSLRLTNIETFSRVFRLMQYITFFIRKIEFLYLNIYNRRKIDDSSTNQVFFCVGLNSLTFRKLTRFGSVRVYFQKFGSDWFVSGLC
jgi:hypothetical protein